MSSGRPCLALAVLLALGCAPIDVSSEVSVHPREGAAPVWGLEQLGRRDFVVDYVQLGSRLLVSLREHRSCVGVRHIPVMRVEKIHRSNRGFVAWDFGLGAFTGAFAALAFARPQLFSARLIDNQGREVYDYTSAYVVGGVFAAISAGLVAAGTVDALRSRDTTRYAAAFEVEFEAPSTCRGGDGSGLPVAERSLRLRVVRDERGDERGDQLELDLELDATTDAEGRASFELSSWSGVTASGITNHALAVILEIPERPATDAQRFVEVRPVVLTLELPFEGMVEAHTGIADTRVDHPPSAVEFGPAEGPPSP